MSAINTQVQAQVQGQPQTARAVRDAVVGRAPVAESQTAGNADADTVSLSEGAQAMVNLNRGGDLAAQIKDAPVDKNFADTLDKATKDVFRVGTLFNQSMRALFGLSR